jgi:ribosomal subunit interface protein
MKLTITFVNLDSTPSIKMYVEARFSPVARLIKHVEEGGERELHVELARATRHHHKGLVYRVSARLALPGKRFEVIERHSDIRSAVTALRNKLREAVERHKDAAISRRRR